MGINTLRWLLLPVFIIMISFDAAAVEPSSSHDADRIGPNDVIRILVFGEEELTVERRVDGDGKIDYPFLGAILGEGKTIEELQQYQTTRLAAGYL